MKNYTEIYLEYLRKSREDLDYEKNNADYKTLERHKERLKLITESANKPVLEENIYEEVVSGDSISERPKIQELLKRIEDSNVKGVWVIDVQRLCRGDLGDQDKIIKTFKYSNTLILTPDKEYDLSNPADEEYLIDKLSYSRKEYNNIKKRLTEGRKDSVRNGLFISSTPAYGYERYKLKGQKGFSLKIVEDDAKVVRMIFKLCLDGMGTYAIASYLNNLGIKSPKGSTWKKNGIREMLHNETYIGNVKWQSRKHITVVEDGKLKQKVIRQKNGEYMSVKGKHESIISEEDFKLVQEKLKASSTKYVKQDKELQNPLAGILRCSKCGHVMARRINNKAVYYSPRGSKQNPKYYEAKPLVYCTHKCNNRSHTLEYVEELLIEELKTWIKEQKKVIKSYEKIENSIFNKVINKIEIIDKEISQLNIKLDRLRDFLEDGIYDKETYKIRSSKIIEDIKKLEKEKEKISKENEQIKMKKIRSIIPNVEYCINNYFKLSVKQKNEILHSILEKVMYTKTKCRKENDLKLELFMKI